MMSGLGKIDLTELMQTSTPELQNILSHAQNIGENSFQLKMQFKFVGEC